MKNEKLTESARLLEPAAPYVTDGTRADIYELSSEPAPLNTLTFRICPQSPFSQSESAFVLTQLV